ncbi:MAG: hypothetical protein LWW84_13765 [Azovibrio sp.]|nr:hypothetical protein [Azovibrio sp.]
MSETNIEAWDNFLFLLDWLLAVESRYPGHLQFGLAYVDYESPRVLGEAFGARRAAMKLDEVSHSLRRLFRKSDLVARDGSDVWILVPYTPADESLADKIAYIVEAASQGGLQIIERDIVLFSLPLETGQVPPGLAARDLLAYLKNNREALALREVVLPAVA